MQACVMRMCTARRGRLRSAAVAPGSVCHACPPRPFPWHASCTGLCDAHVHCTAVTANLGALQSLPESYVTARAAEILGGMLGRGFTTVRDAGDGHTSIDEQYQI